MLCIIESEMDKFPVIREMTIGDLEEVFRIERDSFSIPWSKDSIKKEIESKNSVCLVAETEGSIEGFIMARAVLDEAELLEFAVREHSRGRGIGRELLSKVLDALKQRGVKVVYLEVRPSNKVAVGLYKSAGFSEYGRRRDYYMEPREDALLMKLPVEKL